MKVTLLARPQLVQVSERPCRDDQMQRPDAQQLIEFAGRICYDSFGTGRNSDDYAANILESGHGSVLEHAQYSFLIEGVSRNLLGELTRHRVGTAYSVRSTRFCDETDTDVVLHPLLDQLFERRPDLRERFEGTVDRQRVLYSEIVREISGYLAVHDADRHTARKQARGAARACLSGALATELVFSANVRALRHIIEMRASTAADAEIRLLADELLAIMDQELPAYFGDYQYAYIAEEGVGFAVTTPHRKV